ncbi:hypothetical protein RHMOL_Rhmol13G0070400 [Rhododendron molle]|uniref:Uncharacterized protein n=1 Tax=Rhododendron molle TaxID=49168 RepID=A0ACC0L3T3_RHOML|nr:hypothetical protein RHMOL_Rhmol13G0070400 [Rhododendron molle]
MHRMADREIRLQMYHGGHFEWEPHVSYKCGQVSFVPIDPDMLSYFELRDIYNELVGVQDKSNVDLYYRLPGFTLAEGLTKINDDNDRSGHATVGASSSQPTPRQAAPVPSSGQRPLTQVSHLSYPHMEERERVLLALQVAVDKEWLLEWLDVEGDKEEVQWLEVEGVLEWLELEGVLEWLELEGDKEEVQGLELEGVLDWLELEGDKEEVQGLELEGVLDWLELEGDKEEVQGLELEGVLDWLELEGVLEWLGVAGGGRGRGRGATASLSQVLENIRARKRGQVE